MIKTTKTSTQDKIVLATDATDAYVLYVGFEQAEDAAKDNADKAYADQAIATFLAIQGGVQAQTIAADNKDKTAETDNVRFPATSDTTVGYVARVGSVLLCSEPVAPVSSREVYFTVKRSILANGMDATDKIINRAKSAKAAYDGLVLATLATNEAKAAERARLAEIAENAANEANEDETDKSVTLPATVSDLLRHALTMITEDPSTLTPDVADLLATLFGMVPATA